MRVQNTKMNRDIQFKMAPKLQQQVNLIAMNYDINTLFNCKLSWQEKLAKLRKSPFLAVQRFLLRELRISNPPLESNLPMDLSTREMRAYAANLADVGA